MNEIFTQFILLPFTHNHSYIHKFALIIFSYIHTCIHTYMQAVESIRIGDIDGFEDPERRSILDGLGFSWGDLSKYQRFRFPPMMVITYE